MAVRTAMWGIPFYGLRAHNTALSESLIRAALSWCPGVTITENQDGIDVTVAAPHRLTASLTLSGVLQVISAGSRADRQQTARQVRSAIKCDWRVNSAHQASLGAIVTKAVTAQLVSFEEGGVTFHLGLLSPRHRVLALGEIYACLQPEGAPPLWWGVPGGKSHPGETAQLGILMRQFDRAGIAAMTAVDTWLRRVNATDRAFLTTRIGTSFEGLLGVGDEAKTVLLRLLRETGQITVEAQESTIRVAGGNASQNQYLSRPTPNHSGLYGLLLDHLRQAKGDFVEPEGEDLCVHLARLPDVSHHDGLRRMADLAPIALKTVALAELYHLLRTAEQPLVGYWQFMNTLQICLRWPADQFHSAEAIAKLLDWWEEISGKKKLIHR